jgi:sigma-B regulation protein RsbU (phosphoserine phosphatase)
VGSQKLGLFLADVSGKGVSAALVGAALHAPIWAHAPAADNNSGEVLSKVNGLLFDSIAEEKFATAFYAVYEPSTATLTYANARHH